ncbi:Sec-independent protein translocase subunit TatA [Lapillicoccus sp.]|uniref:Sec-independent protein translocase subunit TatA n=1 Tax=Lapillicoccus sp. TaxID=1909287 RepID=UPI0027D0A179|nr:Sec-independent protein translocase subunit TatA [Actinomycetota bacterium]
MLKDLAQPSHLLIIAVLLVILFGWKRLPDAARSMGRSMRIFKSEVSEMKNDGKDVPSPSKASSETVPGDVVPPQQPAPTTPPQAQYVPPQQAQHVPPQQAYTPSQPAQPQYAAPSNGTEAPRDPQQHDNPAL